jgi:hypothetical protein
MKKILRLTESELVSLIKKSLNEQNNQTWADKMKSKINQLTGAGRLKVLEQIWCSVKFGKINAEVLTWKGKQWCGKGGFEETFKVSDDERNKLRDKCPNIYSTPELQNKKEGWAEIYEYFKSGKDGFKFDTENGLVKQPMCSEYYYFRGFTNEGREVVIYSDGDLYYYLKEGGRGLQGTWSWDGTKPVFNLPFTKKAVGYAQTEEDIRQNNKILSKGSRGDLVKRAQFEILYHSNGKINPGCKKGDDGIYRPRLCDGIFGPKTKDAVIYFQKDNKLKDKSGIIGAETWNAMGPTADLEYEVTF